MSNFQIFVDSTSDMFTELRREYDVDYVSMNIVLKGEEKKHALEIAKAIPFSRTNEELVSLRIPGMRPGSIWQLLYALRDCELKNDALHGRQRIALCIRQRNLELFGRARRGSDPCFHPMLPSSSTTPHSPICGCGGMKYFILL